MKTSSRTRGRLQPSRRKRWKVGSRQWARGEFAGLVSAGVAELVVVGLAGVGVFVAPVVDGGGDGGVGGDDL